MKMLKKMFTLFVLALLATFTVTAQEVVLDVSVTSPVLLAQQSQTTYLRVGLTGFALDDRYQRPPVNVAIVLDRSGSMDGEKIARAKEAARMAVRLLDPADIVSIITYSDTVEILVPATRVGNSGYIRERIDSIYADGSTALFAGVSKGAEELRKFFAPDLVNRVILLSDGLANVGPDSPAALGDLGEVLRKSGISVTTIGLGLGYNEDLMVRLAEKSDGNHAFVENSRDLARIFEFEFEDILSVVAQDVEIEITCGSGVRPIRIIGRESEIIGSNVITTVNQLYSNQEKYVVLEVEVESRDVGTQINLANVRLRYDNMVTSSRDILTGGVSAKFSASQERVEQSVNRPAMTAAVLQIATERSEEAVRLRDEGKVEEAQAELMANSAFLQEQAAQLDSDELAGYGAAMAESAESVEDDAEWNSTRKQMVDDQYENKSQQSY